MTKAAAGSGRLARMSLPAPLRTFKGHPDFWPLLALAGLLLVGAGLRGWLLAVWRPAVLGFPDEATYLRVASTHVGPAGDPLHPVGYPVFLIVLRALGASLMFTILVQHLLGMAAGLLLFLTARRAGVPAWPALLPAFVILLCGDEIFLEHAVLSETLFVFLSCGSLYSAIRAEAGRRDWAWALLAGLLVGMATAVRTVGVALIPVIVLWLLLRRPDRRGWHAWARFLAPGLVAAVTSLTIVLAYAGWHQSSAGGFELTSNGAYILYGRVAPWANCRDFAPPPGTSVLCQSIPYDKRPGAGVYIFVSSPAIDAFGPPSAPLAPQSSQKLQAFAVAAIEHQPLTYLWTVVEKFLRVVSPGAGRPGEGQTPSTFLPYLSDPMRAAQAMAFVRSMYGKHTPAVMRSGIDALEAYDSRTHADGLVIALLIVLAAAAPFLVPRRGPRRRAVLLTGFAFILLLTPLVAVDYDYRYVIPALGPLAAAASVGIWGVWRTWWVRQRPAGAVAAEGS